MTRWGDRWTPEMVRERDYKTNKVLKDAYFLPDQPIEKEGEDKESKVQTKCEQWCRDHGYPYLSFKQSKHVQRLLPAGWPDMLIVMPKRIVFIEFKSRTGNGIRS